MCAMDVALYASDRGMCVNCLFRVLEVMRCVLLCMLEAVKRGLCSLEIDVFCAAL